MGRVTFDDNLEGFVILQEWVHPVEGPKHSITVPENGGPLYSTEGRAQAEITRISKFKRRMRVAGVSVPGPDIKYTIVPAKVVIEYPPEDTSPDWAKVDLT